MRGRASQRRPGRLAYALAMSLSAIGVTAAGARVVAPFVLVAGTLPDWASSFVIVFLAAAAIAKVRYLLARAFFIGLGGAAAWMVVAGILPVGHWAPREMARTLYAIRGPTLIFGALFIVLALVGEGLWKLAKSLTWTVDRG